jgi:hypothetical protein
MRKLVEAKNGRLYSLSPAALGFEQPDLLRVDAPGSRLYGQWFFRVCGMVGRGAASCGDNFE